MGCPTCDCKQQGTYDGPNTCVAPQMIGLLKRALEQCEKVMPDTEKWPRRYLGTNIRTLLSRLREKDPDSTW